MSSPNKNIKLLFLNGDLPVFPGWAGHEYLNMIHLTKFAEVGLVSQIHSLEQKEKAKKLIEAGVHLYAWENPAILENNLPIPPSASLARRKIARDIFNFLWSITTRRPADTNIQRFTLRNMAGSLIKALNEQHWDAIIIVQSSRADWINTLPRFPYTVLVFHDVRALVYERQTKSTHKIFQKIASYLEYRQYRKFEKSACEKFDMVLTVSKADEVWMRKNYAPKNLRTAVIPVDGKYFSPLSNTAEKEGLIVFTGMMNHPPNVDAAIYFAQEIFPKIRSRIPMAEFWIVGRDPTPEVRALGKIPGVMVTGSVPDIRSYMAQAMIIVVPLRFGAGMRNKILEAWGMQKYIVSSSVGAEGLSYLDGENIQIADGTEIWIHKVVEGIENADMRARIKIEGRKLVLEEHDPEKLARKYSQIITQEFEKKHLAEERFNAFIDLRWMKPGVAGGIENLSRSFLNELRQLDRYNHYNVLIPDEIKYDFDARQDPNIQFMPHEGPAHFWDRARISVESLFFKIIKTDHWRSAEMRVLQNLNKMDASIALSMPGYIHPDLYPLKNVLIVPDIQHEYFPQFFDAHSLAERKKIYTDSIRRADHLCAISEFTRQTIIERLGIAPECITTTPLAADPLFHPENRGKITKAETARKYSLPLGEYLFFPGNTWPHKNHKAALQALHILRQEYHLDPMLVCTGSAKNIHQDLVDMIRELRLEKHVRFLGYCPSQDLPALYEGAIATIFPSLFEGFGMPVIEAMWCDCPVVCSNTSSLPEIAGEAALLTDPNSPEKIADSIKQCMTDTVLRETMIVRGRGQARLFSWRKFTLQVVSTLHKINNR